MNGVTVFGLCVFIYSIKNSQLQVKEHEIVKFYWMWSHLQMILYIYFIEFKMADPYVLFK